MNVALLKKVKALFKTKINKLHFVADGVFYVNPGSATGAFSIEKEYFITIFIKKTFRFLEKWYPPLWFWMCSQI